MPSLLLQNYVKQYAIIEYDFSTLESFEYYPTPRIGSGLLFPFLGEPYYSYYTDGEKFEINCPKLTMSVTKAQICELKGTCCWLIIAFHPAGAACFFRLPMQTIDKMSIEVDDISNFFRQNYFLEQLQTATNDEERVKLADKLLLKYLERVKKPRDGIIEITNWLNQNPQDFSVAQIAQELRMSRRNLERKFLEQVGVSPKFFLRISRFNWLLRYLQHNPETTWLDLIEMAGFYDQSHLIKDFYEFTGHSPEGMLKLLNPMEAQILKKM
jgi:AraC-like DNA-binding protein